MSAAAALCIALLMFLGVLSRCPGRTYFNDARLPTGASYSPHYGAQAAAYFLFAAAHTDLDALFMPPAVGYVRGMMESLEVGEWRWCALNAKRLARARA